MVASKVQVKTKRARTIAFMRASENLKDWCHDQIPENPLKPKFLPPNPWNPPNPLKPPKA